MSGIPPVWTPPLQQTITNVNGQPVYGDVYFDITNEGDETTRFNVYSLRYTTTFTLISGTFTIPGIPLGVGPRDTDVPNELLKLKFVFVIIKVDYSCELNLFLHLYH